MSSLYTLHDTCPVWHWHMNLTSWLCQMAAVSWHLAFYAFSLSFRLPAFTMYGNWLLACVWLNEWNKCDTVCMIWMGLCANVRKFGTHNQTRPSVIHNTHNVSGITLIIMCECVVLLFDLWLHRTNTQYAWYQTSMWWTRPIICYWTYNQSVFSELFTSVQTSSVFASRHIPLINHIVLLL